MFLALMINIVSMKIRLFIVAAFLFLGSNILMAQEQIKWVTFEEAVKLSEKEPKKLLIDLYTDWCGWCKKMDRDTYANEKIAKYINKHYYAVKFDAEQKEDVVFQGHTFKFRASGNRGVHELAAALTNNKLSYPTTVFMNEDLAILQPLPGYYSAENMEPILYYYGENAHTKTPWPDFQKSFESKL